ncbi:uncharacterized protein LOC127137146 [Lathyrus oleraceus]|uniref:uncharacterized protein LOC127137146 n=1 Tax=Pisum sativum TaxID=3888 RepID=UPI0021D1D173|nr:uncharacterized protein LOC127137146 [Pisum sativum]
MPPKNRKFECGNDKRKKKKKIEELIQSQVGALDKFLIKEPQVSNESRYVDNIDSLPIENDNLDSVPIENDNLDNMPIENDNLDSVPIENDNLNSVSIENDNLDSVPIVDEVNNDNDADDNVDYDIFDPRNWDRFQPKLIDLLVVKGPKRDNSIVKGPRDSLNRCFTANLYTIALTNGEVCDRDWLVYSKELDRVFCFCCKVFKNGIVRGELANEGYSDWVHVGERIKEHELGMEHVKNMTTWYEYRKRLQKFQTIDKTTQRLIEKEKDHWKNVLKRVISIVKFLAKHNLAFRGSKEKLYEDSNGNFLGLIEIHQEQMSLIIRYVDISSASVSIEESFLGFLNVNDTSGQVLFDVLQNKLKELGLDLFNVRGQGYDNWSNMKGKHQDNVKGLTPKSLSSTRWESRVESVKAIRTQMLEFTERILLTIPVTVASAERSFSKLKLLKTYLRSTMSQERLNGLALIAIENDIL